MAESDRMRLFVAVDMPPGVKSALATAVEELARDLQGPFGWVAPDNIHLTLKFLGDVDAGRVDDLGRALQQAVEPLEPFELHLAGTGTFPEGRRPSVVWAGLGGDLQALTRLQDMVESAMVAQGFEAEARAFQPHLTLGRVSGRLSDGTTDALRQSLASLRFAADESIEVRGVALVRSELGSGSARYTKLFEAML